MPRKSRPNWTRSCRRAPSTSRPGTDRRPVAGRNAVRRNPAERLLDQVAATLALVDENAQRLVDFCSTADGHRRVAGLPVSAGRTAAALSAQPTCDWSTAAGWHNTTATTKPSSSCRDLTPADVVDPAALLFYQCVAIIACPTSGSASRLWRELLEHQQQIPRRYLTVAQLIQADIEPLEKDSLDEISRLMDEVHRRLELKRAGTRVRQQEDEVIAKLDKLIKKIEEQQQQQQAAASVGNLQPSNPAQDSLPMGGKGRATSIPSRSAASPAGATCHPPNARKRCNRSARTCRHITGK